MINDEFHARFQDILPKASTEVPITIVGAGAMGSNICLMLAKMGFEDITVYDFDAVDTVNIGCQLYRTSDIDVPKVHALRDIIHQFSGIEIKAVNRKWRSSDRAPGIMIMAVDNMDTRGQIWDAHKLYPQCKLVIDSRMGAEEARLIALDPTDYEDQKYWDGNYYTSDQVEPVPCTAKATYYTAGMLSGLVVKAVKDYVTKADKPLRSAIWTIANNNLLAWSKQ